MKRPLAVVGLIGLSAQCLALLVRPLFSLLFGIIVLLGGVVAVWIPKIRRYKTGWVGLLTAGVVIILTAVGQWIRVEPIRTHAGITANISGVVIDRVSDEKEHALVVEAEEVRRSDNGEVLCSDLRLVLYTSALPTVKKYDRITIEYVSLYAPEEGFGFSSRSYYSAKGIYLLGSFSKYSCTAIPAESRPWYACFEDMQSALADAIRTLLPKRQSALTIAMLLGDRSNLSAEVTEQFRRSGLSAMLVVSGMHLSVVIGGLLVLLRGMVRSYRMAALLCLPLTVVFLGITGFGGSAVRAGVSMLIFLISILLSRDADPLNSLGAAAILMLIGRPFIGGDVGVQLSFLATGGILSAAAPIQTSILARLPEKWGRSSMVKTVVNGVSASLAAVLFTTPLLILVFGQFSLIAPISNVLFMLPAQILLYSSGIAACFGTLGISFIAQPASVIAGVMANWFLDGSELLAQFPVLHNTDGRLALWVSMVLIGVGILLVCGVNRRRILMTVGACAVLLIIPATAGAVAPSKPSVTAIQCGDGIAVHIQSGGESLTILHGGGDRMKDHVCSYFQTNTVGTLILADEAYNKNTAETVAALVKQEMQDRVLLTGSFVPDELRRLVPMVAIETNVRRNISVGEEISAEWIETESGIWYDIEVSGNRIRIPVRSGDVTNLSTDQLLSVDLLILSDSVENGDLLRADQTILSCSAYSASKVLQSVLAMQTQFYLLSDTGTVTVVFDEYHRGHMEPAE